MSQFYLEVGKILPPATKKSWSQVHVFSPGNKKKLKSRGQLVAVISLKKTDSEKEIVSFGREIISRLHEEYFGNLKASISVRLKKAILKVSQEISKSFKVEIIALVLDAETAFLAVLGGGKIILKRHRSAVICRSRKNQFHSSHGHLKKGDLVFLANRSLADGLTPELLKTVSGRDPLQENIEVLAPLVYGKKEFHSAAAIIKISPPPRFQKRLFHLPFQPLANAIKRFFGKLARLDRRKVSDQKVYLSQASAQRGKRSSSFLGLALILAFLLISSLALSAKQKKASLRQKENENLISQVELKLEEAKNLADLNSIRARQLLSEAQTLINQIEAIEEFKNQISPLKKRLEETLSLILRKYQLEKLPVFFDLEIIKKAGQGKSFLLSSKEELIILDSLNKTLYAVNVKNKKGEILTGGDWLGDASKLALSDNKLLVLTKEGIVEKSLEGKTKGLVVETDPDWKQIVDFLFYQGSLYLLDPASLAIYRYPVFEKGFGAKQSWLKEAPETLADSVSMAINGSIWVLGKNGQILKFTRGLLDSFGLAGLDHDLKNPSQIYTDLNLENLYLLDSGNQRIVVFAKNGEYQAQYLWNQKELVKDMVVSEELAKIWLLGGSKIYEIELKK